MKDELRSFRQRVFDVIDDGFDSDWYDKAMLVFILMSLGSVVIETVNGIPADLAKALKVVEVASAAVFTFDYLLRLWTAKVKYGDSRAPVLKAILSPMGVIDLMAIAPFYVSLFWPAGQVFNILRVFRALKLVRYLKSAEAIVNVIYAERKALSASLFLIGVILFLAASLVYVAENGAQPDKFPDIVTSFWWAIVTLTTVGYGDVFPITVLGRIIGGILAISGIFIVAIPTGILSGGFLNEFKKNMDK